jgi:hypothetical protein
LIISEESKAKQVWDIYCMVCVVYVGIVVPFRLGFSWEDTTPMVTVSYIIDFTFLLDIILTFFSEVYVQDEFRMISEHRDIAKRYLTGWFVLDIISIFPFELFF